MTPREFDTLSDMRNGAPLRHNAADNTYRMAHRIVSANMFHHMLLNGWIATDGDAFYATPAGIAAVSPA